MKSRFQVFIAVLIALGAALIWGGGQAHAYTQTRLMDDQIFDNVGSLNATQVADFLAARPGPFTKLATASTCLSGYNDINFHWDNVKWHYGSDVDWNTAWGPAQIPASVVIAQAAQMWGINPEVLIATLQKEESLITGTSCDTWRYNSALGYGCPDSGGCNPKYVGFSRQVLWGAWQLKFNKERSYGNTTWDGDDVVTYVGYMTQGNRKRCGSCTTNYYDGYATLDGQSVQLENGTTASLYTYTPHLGNSTPVNFEKWFGAAVLPSYSAQFYNESAFPTLLPGQSTTSWFEYKNTGNATWYDNLGVASAPANSYVTHIGTSRPINRKSLFGSTWGGDQNRPVGNFANVYLADGITLTSDQHVVLPGQVAKFEFVFTAPGNVAPGVYREFFQPIADGSSNGAFNDPGTFLDITTQTPTFSSAYAGQSGWPNLTAGQQVTSFLSYKNTGNMPWYDNAAMAGAPAGTLPVHLSTSRAINRSSGFGAAWGGDKNRPSGAFNAVYEADGTTLAANQHIAQPGQIAKFNLVFTAPNTVGSGTYREYFQPIVESGSIMNDPGTFLDITLQPYSYISAYYGQSPYPLFARGSSANVYISYKNAGAGTWFNLTSALPGVMPITLSTSRPINRGSALSDVSWCNHIDRNRPTANCSFTNVYEADGTTLAANQNITLPGQIAKFAFIVTAASYTPAVSYREYFQPILEGVSVMNDVGTFLDINVTP